MDEGHARPYALLTSLIRDITQPTIGETPARQGGWRL